jgi:hypothetical protein
MRAGLVEFNLSKAKDLSRARVLEFKHWCHGDEDGIKRDDVVEDLVTMLTQLLNRTKKSKLRLAADVQHCLTSSCIR